MRHPTTILLFIVCTGAVSGALAASGTAEWLGYSPNPGVSEDINDSEEELADYSASRDDGDTDFIGATISAVDEVLSAFVVIFALSDLLVNLGLPGWAAAMLASPLAWSFGLFIVYMISGRAEVRPR